MKPIVVAVVLLAAVGLALPVTNLIVGPPQGALPTVDAKADPGYANVVTIFNAKCANCHTEKGKMPFYASFPIARGIIEADIRQGTRFFDMGSALAEPSRPAPEATLAMTEFVTLEGSMPPLRYRLLHWDAGLTDSDREAILSWARDTRAKHYATAGIPQALKSEIIQPLPQKTGLDPAKVALGNKLYHDVRLSGDDTLSCASCHALDKGGTDQARFSTGIRKQMGGINSPTVYNSVFMVRQFWDGRAADLKEQANGPVNNPIEMGSNWPEAIGKLSTDKAFVAQFKAVYPNGLTSDNITDAIATFEASLVTPNSRFDKYLLGDETALSDQEKRGWELFQATGCQTCHVGKAMGGQSFEIMGRVEDYFAARGNVTDADAGRFNFTKNEADRGKFKVPTLRNVALTYPYFHDGSANTLEEAVDTMVTYQTEARFSDEDKAAVAAFLRTLTGEYNGKPLQ
jgi:cytochrome c peroxidase